MIGWLACLLSKLRRQRTDADIQDELRAHLDMQEEDLTGAACPPPRRAAARGPSSEIRRQWSKTSGTWSFLQC